MGSIRLFHDYEANEVAADNRYRGKPVRVTGRVFSVEKNLMDAAVRMPQLDNCDLVRP